MGEAARAGRRPRLRTAAWWLAAFTLAVLAVALVLTALEPAHVTVWLAGQADRP